MPKYSVKNVPIDLNTCERLSKYRTPQPQFHFKKERRKYRTKEWKEECKFIIVPYPCSKHANGTRQLFPNHKSVHSNCILRSLGCIPVDCIAWFEDPCDVSLTIGWVPMLWFMVLSFTLKTVYNRPCLQKYIIKYILTRSRHDIHLGYQNKTINRSSLY